MKYTARAPLRLTLAGSWTCIPGFAEPEGGAALCVAITAYAEGSIALPTSEGMLGRLRSDKRYVSYTLDLPIGSGLGASAAQTVLWVALCRSVIDNSADREEIARTACEIGKMLRTLRGQHDVFASALGDVTFHRVASTVQTERLQPAPSVRDDLASRLVLTWSGERGQSSAIVDALEAEIARGAPSVVDGLKVLKGIAMSMGDAVKRGDIDAVPALVEEHARRQREVFPDALLPAARELADTLVNEGAIVAQPCGLAGGMVLAIARPGDRDHLMQAMSARGVRVVNAGIDTFGVHLRKA